MRRGSDLTWLKRCNFPKLCIKNTCALWLESTQSKGLFGEPFSPRIFTISDLGAPMAFGQPRHRHSKTWPKEVQKRWFLDPLGCTLCLTGHLVLSNFVKIWGGMQKSLLLSSVIELSRHPLIGFLTLWTAAGQFNQFGASSKKAKHAHCNGNS